MFPLDLRYSYSEDIGVDIGIPDDDLLGKKIGTITVRGVAKDCSCVADWR